MKLMPIRDRRTIGVTGWLQIATFLAMVGGGVFALGTARADLGNALNEIGQMRKAFDDFTRETRASLSVHQAELARHAVRLEMTERQQGLPPSYRPSLGNNP